MTLRAFDLRSLPFETMDMLKNALLAKGMTTLD